MSVDPGIAVPSKPRVQDRVLAKLIRSPLAIAAMVVLVAMVVVAVLSPWITPHPPNRVVLQLTNAPPFHAPYLLGGDRFGRDELSRLIASTRGALQAAVIMTTVAAVLGVSAGLLAGYFGRIFDSIGSWVFAVLMAAPGIIVLIALYTVVGTSPAVAMAVLGVLVSPSFFWLVRSLTRAVRNELYVDAARVSGLSNLRIVGRHVLIAIRAPVIIMASFLAGAAVSVQAGLEFLGLGNPATPTWGGMLADAFNNIYIAPIQLLWPGLALGLVVAAFVLSGSALRDALQGTDIKRSTRTRRKEIESILGSVAAAKTLPQHKVDQTPASAGGVAHTSSHPPLLAIEGMQIAYQTNRTLTTVVGGVSLAVEQGEVVGLVGESGSGKTQIVFAALGLLPEQAVVTRGSIKLDGIELLGMPEKQLETVRGTKMAYVPQEPMSNLDPSFKVGAQLVYGIRAQTGMSAAEARILALSMLERVGINDPTRTFRSYPHEISGGMAQRVLIAGAVACRPQLLLADEPTTALDVTVQAEVLDLLRDLQQETNMGVLIVTHNFGVVADLCDRVAVMRTGKVVEEGLVKNVFTHPQHEYTKMLLGSILDDSCERGPLVGRQRARDA